MKSKIVFIILLLLPFMLVTNKVKAESFSNRLDNRILLSADCTLFGDPNDDGGEEKGDPNGDGEASVAYFLQEIFEFIRYLGPALTIVLTIVEFVKAAAAQDADALARAAKKTGWRIALCIVLFFIPVIINTTFSWFGWYGTCGIK